MSANTAAEVRAASRPKVVDYAVYALIIRCVCSVGAALALYGARGEVSRSLADANKDKNWSAETLRHNVDAALRANVITTLVMVVLVAIMIKLIRDGRGWARWLYLAFALLITRDVFQVLGFFQYDHVLTRVLTGLVGLSSLAALALLFLPEANAYFRPENGSSGLLGNLFRPRTSAAAAGPGVARPGTARPGATRPGVARSGAETAVASRPDGEATSATDAEVATSSEPAATPRDEAGAAGSAGTTGLADPAQPARPPAPRGKSRQSGQVSRNGRR